MSFQFTPLEDKATVHVPFLEDARADFAPYYTTEKKPEVVQSEIIVEMGKVGGYGVHFQMGIFGDKPKRYGYNVRFMYNGAPGLFRVAGLPMHTETDKKRNQVLAQALCIVRDWAKQMVTAKVFMPGSEPLVQYLLVDPRGTHTITDQIIQSGRLPALPGSVTVEGEVVDGE